MGWIDCIDKTTEIRRVYGRDPLLKDVFLFEFSIDYTKNILTIDVDFFDWPSTLPEGWYIKEDSCISLRMNLKNVHFNHVDLSKSFISCNIDIESLADNSLHLTISDNEGFCFYNLTAESAEIVNFNFWDHSWD